MDKIVAAGLALIGLIGAFMPDNFVPDAASVGRTRLPQTPTQAASATVKAAVLILAVLSAMSGPLYAQSTVLPWRAQIHQRLQKLETQPQATPAPAPIPAPAPRGGTKVNIALDVGIRQDPDHLGSPLVFWFR